MISNRKADITGHNKGSQYRISMNDKSSKHFDSQIQALSASKAQSMDEQCLPVNFLERDSAISLVRPPLEDGAGLWL